MHKRHPVLAVGALVAFMLTSVQVYAGGPLLLLAPGVPFLWPNGGQNIPFNPDLGGLGSPQQRAGGRAVDGGVQSLGRRRLGQRDARQRRAIAGRRRRDELPGVFLSRRHRMD